MTKELHGFRANNRGLPITYWDAIELLKRQRIEIIVLRCLVASTSLAFLILALG